MTAKRGGFLVLEGCDRVGKSTQVKKLVEALNARGIPAESRSFPDRSTTIGEVINNFLLKRNNLPPETVHLLFAANRWECSNDMIRTLKNGTTLVVDRYAASGAAYTAANTLRDLSWCKEPDRGLPAPDMVFFLKSDGQNLNLRENWGVERFENTDFQKRVSTNYEKLKDNTWQVIDANQSIVEIHTILLNKAIELIKEVSDKSIESLYDSS